MTSLLNSSRPNHSRTLFGVPLIVFSLFLMQFVFIGLAILVAMLGQTLSIGLPVLSIMFGHAFSVLLGSRFVPLRWCFLFSLPVVSGSRCYGVLVCIIAFFPSRTTPITSLRLLTLSSHLKKLKGAR